MILIRGIKGEAYARRIKKGIVDCRDVLSAVLQPPITGYEFSDYYEKNLVKALMYFAKGDVKDLHDPQFLYSLFIDAFIPHIYLTYFHVLNEHSLEWLEKFDDDYQFIAVNAKLDKITKTVIGNGYFGARMSYVDDIRQLSQDNNADLNVACMCSLENQFVDKGDMMLPLSIYNTLSFPLFCREQDERFTDIENEFRIIAYECPKMQSGLLTQIPRIAKLEGQSGIEYEGILECGVNTLFQSKMRLLRYPYRTIRDILFEENGHVKVNSVFRPINIRDISDDYRYLGGKKECENYMREMISNKPAEIFVDRSVIRTHRFDELQDAIIMPGHQEVEY